MSVVVERDGAVGIVRLDRPEARNALSAELMSGLADALRDLDADPAIRCIVLTGDERAFAAGADVAELAATDADALAASGHVERWTVVRSLDTPTIAAVCGHCLGGGFELALSCDIVVAGPTARFGLPETGLGVIPGGGGTQRLARAAGKALAMDVVLTGRTLDAQEALAAGIVARLVDQPLETAIEMAETVASRAPLAQRLGRRAVAAAAEVELDHGLDLERAAFFTTFASPDAREGLAAFTEKRRPEWTSS